MTDGPRGRQTTSSTAVSPPRWWHTLAFRLGLVINLAVIAVFTAFAFVDYRREEVTYIRPEIARLQEEAQALRVAWTHFPDVEEFQAFLDQFCHQMGSAVSPGHHIVVFDGAGRIVTRAHERADPILEAKMAVDGRAGVVRFVHGGQSFVSVGVKAGGGATIAVAQSLAPVEQLLHAQRVSRVTSVGILVVLVFGLTTIALLVWVRDPLAKLGAAVSAAGNRKFDFRVHPSGSSELRYLAGGVNAMIRSLQRVERQREAEMRRARDIQHALLPRNALQVNGFDVHAVFLPTESVGGDLYDVVELEDGSTILALFDVSGHGVSAALCTALLRTILRHHAPADRELAGVADAMNVELADVAPSGTFATCLLVRLLPNDEVIEYVSAGHEPGFIVRASGKLEEMEARGLVLGVDRRTDYEVSRHTLDSTDRLYLYTDGLHEVFDQESRVFGRKRLAKLLTETRSLPLQEQLETVVRGVQAFQCCDQFDDDVTLLCARRK